MNSRVIEIYQAFPMSLESVYYARNTVITVTQDTGEAKKSGEQYLHLGLIEGSDRLADSFANTRIFNIHVSDEKEVNVCKAKLDNYICLFDKKKNYSKNSKFIKFDPIVSDKSTKREPAQHRPSTQPQVILREEVRAYAMQTKGHSSQVVRNSGYGHNFYKEDLDSSLIENFIKNGSLPLPLYIQKTNCNNKVKKIVYCVGAAALTFGMFAFQSSLVSSDANHFGPKP